MSLIEDILQDLPAPAGNVNKPALRAYLAAREIVMVEDYGGIADGTIGDTGAGADNTAALNEAFDALPETGGTVFLGSGRGVYRVAAAPTWKANVTIASLSSGRPGQEGPYIYYTGTGTFLDTTGLDSMGLRGFILRGASVVNAIGVKLRHMRGTLENMTIEGFDGAGGWGLQMQGVSVGNEADWCHLRDVLVQACDRGIKMMGFPTNSNHLSDVRTSGCNYDGLWIEHVNGLTLHTGDHEGNCVLADANTTLSYNIRIEAGANIHMFGAYVETGGETAYKKGIKWPTGGADPETQGKQIWHWGYNDGALPATFYNERNYTYFISNPNRLVNDEAARITTLCFNNIQMEMRDNTGATVLVGPVMESVGSVLHWGGVDVAAAAYLPLQGMANYRTLANDGVIDLTAYLKGRKSDWEGMLEVFSDQDHADARFWCKNGTATEREDVLNKFSHTKDTATSINVYRESGAWKLQNKSGGSRNLTLHLKAIT